MSDKDETIYSHSMTLRDHFAAQVMQGLATLCASTGSDYRRQGWKYAAEEAYKAADAMMEARK